MKRPSWLPLNVKHVPRLCPICSPYIDMPSFRRGTAKAKANTAKLTEKMEREDA